MKYKSKKSRRLRMNKIFAVILILIGWLSTLIEGDYTAAVIFWIMAIGLILARDNVIDW